MIREHRRKFKVLRLSFDIALMSALYYALYLGTLHLGNPFGLVLEHPDYAWRFPAFLSLCWAASFLALGVYDKTRLSPNPLYGLGIAFQALLVMMLLLALGIFAFKLQYLSRKFMSAYALGCLAILTISKTLELRLLSMLRRMGYNTMSVILVGEGKALETLAKAFEGHGEWGYRVLGVLSAKKPRGGLRHLGQPAKLGSLLRTRIVDELILAPGAGQAELLSEAAQAGVRVRMLLPEMLQGWSPQLDMMGGLTPSLEFVLGRRNPYAQMLKSALEWVAAFVLILLLAVPMLLIAMLVALSMGFPVLFVQRRAGKNGRVFKLYKFRSMVADARDLQEGLEDRNEMKGPTFKLKDDPRVTPLGRFLRKTSLDELPQLFNVLRGDMALVGPRAMAQYEARKVPAWAMRRFSVKPGVTCLREVSGRSQLSFEQWMRSDLEYLDRWSLWLDFSIALRTLPAVLASRGAY